MDPGLSTALVSDLSDLARLTLREALRTLAALLSAHHVLVLTQLSQLQPFSPSPTERPHEAYLQPEQPASSAHSRLSRPHGHPSGSSGPCPAPRERSQASDCLSACARFAPPARLICLSPARPFKPAQRLRQKSEFDRVYRDARRSADAMFAVFARNTGAAVPRLGLAIAARIVGNAVRRNRIKRLVRESFRQHQHELPAVDLVVNARSGAREADNAAITRSLERHWRSVVKQCASS